MNVQAPNAHCPRCPARPIRRPLRCGFHPLADNHPLVQVHAACWIFPNNRGSGCSLKSAGIAGGPVSISLLLVPGRPRPVPCAGLRLQPCIGPRCPAWPGRTAPLGVSETRAGCESPSAFSAGGLAGPAAGSALCLLEPCELRVWRVRHGCVGSVAGSCRKRPVWWRGGVRGVPSACDGGGQGALAAGPLAQGGHGRFPDERQGFEGGMGGEFRCGAGRGGNGIREPCGPWPPRDRSGRRSRRRPVVVQWGIEVLTGRG